MSTATQLVQRVIKRIAQVAGTSVQTYAEDIILEQLQHGFDVLFDEFFWPGYSDYTTALALDGVNGIVTADLTSVVRRYKDISAVWFSADGTTFDKKPLPFNSKQTNPATFTGTRPRVIAPYNTTPAKIFSVWPRASVGFVMLHKRLYPIQSLIDNPEQDVALDDQLLILKCAYDYLEDDGSNPGAADKFLAMFDARHDQIQHELNKGPFLLDDARDDIPSEWEEMDH